MRRMKFQDQLHRSFILYVSVILLAILLLYLGGFVLNFATVVVRANRESNRSLTEQFCAQYTAYAEESRSLSQLPQVREVLSHNTTENRSQVNRLLYEFTNRQAFRSYFVLMDLERNTVCSNFNERNQQIFASSVFVSSVISRLDKAQDSLLCFVCTAPLARDQECCYSFCQTVFGADGAPMGYLFFNLREESFHSYARTMSQDLLITDPYDNIVYTTLDPEEDPMDKLPSGKYSLDVDRNGILKFDGVYHYVYAQTITDQQLSFYTLTSLEMQVATLWYSLFFFLVMLAVMAVIVTILTRTFAQRNAKEIGELTRAVEELDRGNMDYQLSSQSSEESQLLYSEFKRITLRLRELIHHNNELLDRRRQMEVKQLEEQFNPHFVFNVMETVRYQIAEDPETASEMLLSFANLMRYSINYGQAKVTLETDVEYVNDYLLLQKIRYNNCLEYEFHIPEELLDCQIPKLLLQPLIENSIKHGFRQGHILKIAVEVQKAGDDLRFTVRDNGAGIPPERLAAINESFNLELNSTFVKHIGLYNIQKMLFLLYGPRYGIHIESAPGEGTCVVLTMPCEMEESEC